MKRKHPEKVEDYYVFKANLKSSDIMDTGDLKLSSTPENIDYVLVKYLIIECGLPFRYVHRVFLPLLYMLLNVLPFSLVEASGFIAFMSIVCKKWKPFGRRALNTKLEVVKNDLMLEIKAQLKTTESVSLTIDLWTDKRGESN
jgi:hypothetical protein